MAKTRKPKKQIEPSRVLQCETCAAKPEFDNLPATLEHLKTVHGIDAKAQKAKREGIMHLDGADFYSNTFRWTFETTQEIPTNKVCIIDCQSGPRGKSDYWG